MALLERRPTTETLLTTGVGSCVKWIKGNPSWLRRVVNSRQGVVTGRQLVQLIRERHQRIVPAIPSLSACGGGRVDH